MSDMGLSPKVKHLDHSCAPGGEGGVEGGIGGQPPTHRIWKSKN